jgi:fructosamine-3-kinase
MSGDGLWESIAPRVRDALAHNPERAIRCLFLTGTPTYIAEIMPGEMGSRDIRCRYESMQHLRRITESVCEPVIPPQSEVNSDNEPVSIMVLKYPPASTQGVNNSNSEDVLQAIREIYNNTTAQEGTVQFKYVSTPPLIPVEPNKSWPTFFTNVLGYLHQSQADSSEAVPGIIVDFLASTVPRLVKGRDNTPHTLHGNLAWENIFTTPGPNRKVFLANSLSLIGPIEMDLAIFCSQYLNPKPRPDIGIDYRQKLSVVENKESEDVMRLYTIYHHLLFAWRYPSDEKAAHCREQ